MLDRDAVRRTLMTDRDGRILYLIQQAAKGIPAAQVATLLMGRPTKGCGVSDAIQRLKHLGFISFHMRPSEKSYGPRAIFFWSCTQRGSVWLDYHPEAREPHRPKALVVRRGKAAHTVIAPMPPTEPAQSVPLNLRKYMNRPLPLRVRKACGMPAHYWR